MLNCVNVDRGLSVSEGELISSVVIYGLDGRFSDAIALLVGKVGVVDSLVLHPLMARVVVDALAGRYGNDAKVTVELIGVGLLFGGCEYGELEKIVDYVVGVLTGSIVSLKGESLAKKVNELVDCISGYHITRNGVVLA